MKTPLPVNEECCPSIRSSKGNLPVLDISGDTHNTSLSLITNPSVSSTPNTQVTESSSATVRFVPETTTGVPPSSLPYRGLRKI